LHFAVAPAGALADVVAVSVVFFDLPLLFLLLDADESALAPELDAAVAVLLDFVDLLELDDVDAAELSLSSQSCTP
jgi:hypothetical protein